MSNLYEQIAEDELKLKAETGDEAAQEEQEPVVEEEEEEQEAEAESTPEEEPKADEEKEEEKQEAEPEPKLDATAHFRHRQEKKALQERIEALEAAANPKPVIEDTDPEPDKGEQYEEWLEWKDRTIEAKVTKVSEWQKKQESQQEQQNIWNGAVKEFQGFEAAFQKNTPDYEAAASHMKDRLADSYKLVNPNLTQQQVDSQVSNYILRNAAAAAQDGYNPAESLYNQAKERFGFTKPEVAVKRKTDLKKIDANRRKSASPLQSGGQTNSNHVSIESIAGMSMSEFAKLTPSQLRELESQ